eukprot:CAMPEP_0114558856 /NCGR_PEP_ID=MMETSP0114-20121206/10610_1 /TAXON_ID=31324 /ORGANISM="Goniomonas sp, Strain m" /LENGTH=540 /DNA_ID=CAMNT_0001744285 /DNA_START=9 /DNA_END=1631 /DNA_ORIENTATION=-
MRHAATMIALLGAVVAALPVQQIGDDESVVTFSDGSVRGLVGPTARSFMGIRYSEPAGPSNRFGAVGPAQPWEGILNATEFSAGCQQTCVLPPMTCPAVQSEDCLFLNVFTPRLTAPMPAGGWPVMVWIHGGRFEQGAASSTLYNGTTLAAAGVVLVTMNYRLTLFGFLATDEFDGNAGFHDQVLALNWVQTNIAAFGGNKDKVTLFGQSAGGTSVAAHLASPRSTGLFHRAIIESNPLGIRIRATDDAVAYGRAFAKAAGCPKDNNTECLRSKTPEELLAAVKDVKPFPEPHPLNLVYRWTPTVDGVTIPVQPLAQAFMKQVPTMPMMVGSVKDDGRMFIYELASKPLTELEYRAAMDGVLGVIKGQKAWDEYKALSNKTDERGMMSDETTHCIFACPARWSVSQAIARNNSDSVYMYQFEHALSWDAWGPRYPFCDGYVCHASELPFVFGTGAEFWTAEEAALSEQVIRYWTNFAKSDKGDPNGDGIALGDPVWPAFDPAGLNYMRLDVVSQPDTALYGERCDFWDSLDWYDANVTFV